MLLAHPRDDDLFERIASRQVRLVDAGSRTVTVARRALRRCYRDADLHRQTAVVLDGSPTTMWFAYRDGRSSPAMPATRWWTGAAVASGSVRDTGHLMRANAQFRTLVGLPPTAAGEEAVSDRLGPDICTELRRVARSLAVTDEVAGALDLRLPWGQHRQIEFHARHRAATAGVFDLDLRSVQDRDAAVTRAATAIGLGAASEAEQSRVLRRATRRALAPGEGLGARTDERWAILVLAGIVRLLIRADAVEPTLAYAGHGALLGSHLVADDPLVPVDIQALTPSVVMELPPRMIRDLILREEAFTRAVMDQAQALLGSAVSTLAARTAADLPQRLARELLLLSEIHPGRGLIPVTEQQLADGVGSIRESVGRTLGGFRRKGWVATTSHGLIVLDDPALRGAARIGNVPSATLVAGQ
jgi:CRP-like cAMP-binding protein